jgi:hypothetical protein
VSHTTGTPPKIRLSNDGYLTLNRSAVKELKRCVAEMSDHDFLGGVALLWLDEGEAKFRIEPRLMVAGSPGVWPEDSKRIHVAHGAGYVLANSIAMRMKYLPFSWVEAVPKSGGLEVSLNGVGSEAKES